MSTLRATAAEFLPSFAVQSSRSATGTTSSSYPAQHQAIAADSPQESTSQDGYYDKSGADKSGIAYDDSKDADRWDEGDEEQWQQYTPTSDWQQEQPWLQEYYAPAAARDESQQQQEWEDVSVAAAQAVHMLHAWYPDQPLAQLQQLYDACNGSIWDTLQILSEMEHEQQQQTLASQQVPATSVAAVSSGDGDAAAAASSKSRAEFRLRTEQFPELSTASHQTLATRQASAVASVWQTGSVMNSNAGSWRAVVSKAAPIAAAGASKAAIKGPNNPATAPFSIAKQAHQEAIPWVQTGEVLAHEYADARAEARDYARIRNACFHQATLAYLAGDKALAKELSAKGKEAARQMWAAHDHASQQIYMQRSTQLARKQAGSCSSNSNSNPIIDLHGLHVREVQALLPQQLKGLAAQKQQAVSVIVGTGHHTKGPLSARVGPAVEGLLQKLGYQYCQPQLGLLRVQLQ